MATDLLIPTERIKHILVVDDNTSTLFAYQMLFKKFPVALDDCRSLEEALKLITEQSFDAVITDLRLTGAGSEEGIDILRCAYLLRPETKVILVTGYGSEQLREKALAMGASYYFEKPVAREEMLAALRKMQIISDSN